MASNIDSTKPTTTTATTQSVRDNFAAAKSEIEALQAAQLSLVIGTNVQAWDAQLDTWATVTPGTGVATALAIGANESGGFLTTHRKNALINGDFQIWPEGTSFAAIANSTYFAEMWQYNKSGAMVHTVSQSSNVPTVAEAGRMIPYSVLVDCTTADAAVAASDVCRLTTYVEGSNFVYIAGVGLCHQFWSGHTKTGTYCVAYRNSGADRSFVREYTQNVADTWEFKTLLVDASPTAGTWDYTTGIGLQVSFILTCGTTFQTTAGTWQTGNFLATANQVNACDNVANNFRLAGVQLEKGSVATEFEAMKIQDVKALCLRYGRTVGPGCVGAAIGAAEVDFGVDFSEVPMRTTPTAAIVDTTPSIEEIGIAARTGVASTVNSITGSELGIRFRLTGFGGMTATNPCIITNATPVIFLSARF